MMRILQLTKKVPYPLKDGEAIAINQMAKGLVANGCEVHLLAMNTSKHFADVHSETVISGLSHYAHVETIPVDTKVKVMPALKNLFGGQSYNISRFESKDYERALSSLIADYHYDVVILETLYLTPYVDMLKHKSKAHISMRSHNIESQIWYDLYRGAGRGLKKQYLKICADRLKIYEAETLQSYDSILPISDMDALQYKQQGYRGTLLTTPVGMDLEQYPDVQHQVGSSLKAGYIGSMDWKPNIEGMEWFTDKVWPSVHKDHPIEFHLAGRNMDAKWKNLGLPGFHVAGEVKSAEKFIRDLDLIIVPLFSGSGIRVKILEAMAMGKVVLSTPKGFEGIEIINGVNGFIFNEPNDISDCITQLCNQPSLGQSIGSNARKTIVDSFDNAILSQKVVDLFSNKKMGNISQDI